MKCKCGRESISGRCKSCSNKQRTGKFNWNDSSCDKRKNSGNPLWKGDKVKYHALHAWIRRNKPKSMFCEKCGKITDKLDLANITGKYLRDIMDFRWLCRGCHMKQDYFEGVRHGKMRKM